jgi:hypothetical protein
MRSNGRSAEEAAGLARGGSICPLHAVANAVDPSPALATQAAGASLRSPQKQISWLRSGSAEGADPEEGPPPP